MKTLELVVPYILIAALFTLYFFQLFAADQNMQDVKLELAEESGAWQCNVVNCTRFMTPQEWVDQNCFLSQNETVCKINYQGTNTLLPLNQIDLKNLNQCLNYVCIQEVKVRSVNYPINTTVVQ